MIKSSFLSDLVWNLIKLGNEEVTGASVASDTENLAVNARISTNAEQTHMIVIRMLRYSFPIFQMSTIVTSKKQKFSLFDMTSPKWETREFQTFKSILVLFGVTIVFDFVFKTSLF